MKFLERGPDIPEHLLQKHEEGNVIFFCGAGVSRPAGLPDFKNLIVDVYSKLGITFSKGEKRTFDEEKYDTTLHLLEQRHPAGRQGVRSAIREILSPKWRKKGAKETHEALLMLGADRSGNSRLVTTNFDRIFHHLAVKARPRIPVFAAPMMPVAKKSRWHGVVHLHGLLPASNDPAALNRLVISSGDFGLAYLTERWASTFISDVLATYSVCFVGYGINDPVLRYMMDAISADKALGEKNPEAFAFASFTVGFEEVRKLEWEERGVTPILYEVTSGGSDHSALHDTLKEWGATYRDGIRGQQMIVTMHAPIPPVSTSRLDFAVGRLLWALTNPPAAQHFADLEPAPPLDWLKPLVEPQFRKTDLRLFGVRQEFEHEGEIDYSFVKRPPPYSLAAPMKLVGWNGEETSWDAVMEEIARWLLHHLDDPNLALWFAKNGGSLHPHLARLISGQITKIEEFERNAQYDELTKLFRGSPSAIPNSGMRKLWGLFLVNKIKVGVHDFDLFRLASQMRNEAFTELHRIQIRQSLTPLIAIKERVRLSSISLEKKSASRVIDLIDYDIVLPTSYPFEAIKEIEKLESWQRALPELSDDFTQLLKDCCRLMQDVGSVDSKSDHSHLHRPSIGAHPQNRDYPVWTVLIDLTRDAWSAVNEEDTKRAARMVAEWWEVPYPLFKRLAFFAATNLKNKFASRSLVWLLDDDCWWIWSTTTKREALRLMVYLVRIIDKKSVSKLVEAILDGPPRSMYGEDIDKKEWKEIKDRAIWLRLAKIQKSVAVLPNLAEQRLLELEKVHPRWKVAPDESDEFSFWMSSGDATEWRTGVATPREAIDLAEYLEKNPTDEFFEQDDWRQRCSEDNEIAVSALNMLSARGVWPIDRWRAALQVWADDTKLTWSWQIVSPLLLKAPDSFLKGVAHSIGFWLKKQAITSDASEGVFFLLCRKVLELDFEPEFDTDEPVFQAINHPIGEVTGALLDCWYSSNPEEGDGLPIELAEIFSEICDLRSEKYAFGRILLSAHAIALFRVDEAWSRSHLLPLFDWKTSTNEARLAWAGFLWTARLYMPLLAAIKDSLLETAVHYDEIGEHPDQYAAFLTFIALNPGNVFSKEELASAFDVLPQAGLHKTGDTLVRALDSAGEQCEEYWKNRVQPFIRSIWPQDIKRRSDHLAEVFGRLCVVRNVIFPKVFSEVRSWLQSLESPGYILRKLHKSEIDKQFPTESLEFLGLVVGENSKWLTYELRDCLNSISARDLELKKTPMYVALDTLASKHSRGTN